MISLTASINENKKGTFSLTNSHLLGSTILVRFLEVSRPDSFKRIENITNPISDQLLGLTGLNRKKPLEDDEDGFDLPHKPRRGFDEADDDDLDAWDDLEEDLDDDDLDDLDDDLDDLDDLDLDSDLDEELEDELDDDLLR